MKAFNKIFSVVAIAVILLFVVVNIILAAPIKETKNRFFGKFLWRIDILRENIEQQKQRELEMQKENTAAIALARY